MLPFSPGTALLLLVAATAAAWAAGLVRARYEEGRLSVRFLRSGRVGTSFDLSDTWLLLALALTMGWAIAAAVEHSAWVPGTEGRLVPAMALATVVGWAFVIARLSRLAYLVASLPALLFGLAIFTPSPLTSGGASVSALRNWVVAAPNDLNLVLLVGLLVICISTGLWTSWWIFKRRNGLVALLPTGVILAVEIINDTNAGLYFFSVLWLAAAASVLLRLNFVALKQRWRARRLPRAADSGWTFGEVGVEAIAAILAVAFLLLPPLSSTDISGVLIPGVVHADPFHPFGLGAGGSGAGVGGVGSIGYSEVVRPGSQLRAKSQVVMIVSGDSPTYYPYWRGIALAGWDGISWYPLPSTPEVPVRQQPLVPARTDIPRDDLPTYPQHVQLLHDTFHVVVPFEQTAGTIFSGGEVVSVDNQTATVQGIMTSVPTADEGPVPAPVNVIDSSEPTASFDTVDRLRFARRLQPPYSYSLTEAIPNVDVADLRSDSTDYPAWLAPYTALYEGGRIAQGYSTARDADIASLAQSIVRQAGATNPYDEAKAIESWFLVKGRFTYTLTPPAAPVAVRPLDYFLFSSHRGFCQDFSTAMNVMLRTLGIPSRQMSGFGQGIFDEKIRQYNVNALDAHSWVEVYFPNYGWIPFEPTPDGINAPINRPATLAQLNAPVAPTAAPNTRIRPNLREPQQPIGGPLSAPPFPDLWRPMLTVLAGLLLLALLALLLAVRWLMSARDLPRIWRRLLFLADRLKVRRYPGDTPLEFGGRMAESVPLHDEDLRQLATLFTRANFRRGGLRRGERAEARRAWGRVRGSYAGLLAKAWREAARNGRAVSLMEDSGLESREPSRRR